MALGWMAAYIHYPPLLSSEQQSERRLTGRIEELDYTDFSMQMTVSVKDPTMPRCQVLLSTRGCDYTLQSGDLIAWNASLDKVGNLGNPDEMDYATYLIRQKGIRYQQHLPVNQIARVGHSATVMTRLATARRELALMVFNSRLSPVAQQLVVALLLGDADAIDKPTRQEFAAASIAHVLALSGLHVGVITLIIWWLLFPLDYLRLKKSRLVITLVALALFGIFTGLSPSVVRATVMIGFVFASLIFHRRSVSLNALAMAALVILVFTPPAIYNVGFQLSFVTVLAVLLFARVPDAFKTRYALANTIISIVITSLVAMLATVSLTAHYFHTVSVMSVLANVLVLPVLPVFMMLGALFLLVTAAGLQCALLDKAINAACHYIHWSAGVVNSMPFSHFTGVYVTTVGVIAYFVMVALLVLWVYRSRFVYLLAAGLVLLLMLAHSLWVDYNTPRRGLVIFNSYNSTPLLYYDQGEAYLWSPDDEEPDEAVFCRYHAGFLARHGIDHVHVVHDGDTLRLSNAFFKPPFAHLMGRRILAVGRGKWKNMAVDQSLKINDIVITRRYHGSVSRLKDRYRFDRLILSGALVETRQLLRECDSLGIQACDLGGGAIQYR